MCTGMQHPACDSQLTGINSSHSRGVHGPCKGPARHRVRPPAKLRFSFDALTAPAHSQFSAVDATNDGGAEHGAKQHLRRFTEQRRRPYQISNGTDSKAIPPGNSVRPTVRRRIDGAALQSSGIRVAGLRCEPRKQLQHHGWLRSPDQRSACGIPRHS